MKKRWTAGLAAVLLLCTACAAAQPLRVDFYDMGKADAMLITTPSNRRILIDAGTNKGGKALVSRFEKEKIDTIDVLIITHYDKDHVGGADKMLEELDVGTVYMPVYEKDSKQYDQFVEALEESGAQAERMETGAQTTLDVGDGVTLRITAAHETYYGSDEENDFSLAVRVAYGDTKFLFAGDAEEARQIELLEEGDVQCDVLKVPYHGRLVDVSEQFLAQASPKIAFITDSEEEAASPIVIRMLEEQGAEVYCAKDGGIVVLSDGKTISVEL